MSDHSTTRVKIQAAEYKPPKGAVMRVSVQGERYAEARHSERPSRIGIRKINRDEYVELNTGEIKRFEKNTEKQAKNLRVTFDRLRGLIRANFDEKSENQLFITLTYKENMRDKDRLYVDYEKYMKRLRRYLPEHQLEYIVVAEPQGRGAWHLHVMLKSDKPVLYIEKREITRLWGHGMTTTERLKSDDVGSYYVAYFTDLIGEAGGEKKRKKGARLKYYPVGFNFYRASRGIVKPEEVQMLHTELENKYGKAIYSKGYELVKEDGETGEKDRLNRLYRATHKKSTNE